MVTKHFFKVLTIFASMIVLGLILLLATDYFDKDDAVQAKDTNHPVQIAK